MDSRVQVRYTKPNTDGFDKGSPPAPDAKAREHDMTNVLDQLRTMTTVVADTGEVAAVKTYKPVDCTTNPSLVLKTLEDPASEELVKREIEAGKSAGLQSWPRWCRAVSQRKWMRVCLLTPRHLSHAHARSLPNMPSVAWAKRKS